MRVLTPALCLFVLMSLSIGVAGVVATPDYAIIH
jgi:hypothetical protein